MVMESPTPQCVGLEFVRQYYTIMNKAPFHLYRFYASNSSFMHGGDSSNREPIIGQTEIHKYITDLNYRDCHAKILLIDSQATIGDGVVIQVTGELSNNGRPMRRFMQTFVLSPQSEKKYYVANDIFRYQDQVFNDGCEGSTDEGIEETQQDNGHIEELEQPLQHEAPTPEVAATQPPIMEYPSAAVQQPQVIPPQHINGGVTPQEIVAQQPSVGAQSVAPAHIQHSPVPQQSPPNASVAPTSASSHMPRQNDNSVATVAPVTASAQQAQPAEDNWPAAAVEEWNPNNNWEEAPAAPAPRQQTVRHTPTSPPQQHHKQDKKTESPAQPVTQQPPEQRSYAGVFKSGSLASSSVAPPPVPAQHYQPRETVSRPPQQQQSTNQRDRTDRDSHPRDRDQHPRGSDRNGTDRDGGFQRTGRGGRVNFRNRNNYDHGDNHNSDDNANSEHSGYTNRLDDRRRGPPMSVPDAHRIFVGNVPQTMMEEDLRKVFQEFGTIVELRVNVGKGKSTGPSNGNKPPGTVPNFGFVTFEDDSAVSRCLSARPIIVAGDHRLNVEEKKAKSKMGTGESFHSRSDIRGNLHQTRGFSRNDGNRGPGGPRGGYGPGGPRR